MNRLVVLTKDQEKKIASAYNDFAELRKERDGTLGMSERAAFIGVVKALLREELTAGSSSSSG